MRVAAVTAAAGAVMLVGLVAAKPRVNPHVPLLGAAVNLPFLEAGDTRYASTLRAYYRSITPENEMKMDTVQPERGRFDFSPADRILSFALANGMRVRGHTLVWGKQLPGWVTERTWTKRELTAIMEEHIRTEVRHFRGKVREWDVVNEPIANDDSGSLEPNIWRSVIGPDYVALALRAARSADPTAKLFINEFGTDRPGPKVDALFRLVERLRSRRVPLDGIGFQAHVTLDRHPSTKEFTGILRRFTRLGLRVEVTELDVPISVDGSLDEQLRAQARVYTQIATACRLVAACDRVTTWGFTDASSWLGEEQRPLPFASDYTPKPAFPALRRAVGLR